MNQELNKMPIHKEIREHYIVECPNCKSKNFDITEDISDYKQYFEENKNTNECRMHKNCDYCNYEMTFIYNKNDIYNYIEYDDLKKNTDIKIITILKLNKRYFPNIPDVYLAIPDTLYDHHQQGTYEEFISGHTFWIEENTCPTNFLHDGILELQYDNDGDPHGICDYVESIFDDQETREMFENRSITEALPIIKEMQLKKYGEFKFASKQIESSNEIAGDYI